MTSLQLSIPSKTFILGEYLALVGGPALILCTEPCFQLTVVKNKPASVEGIHPDSPAGRFMREHPAVFEAYQLQFNDPYQGRGGLGASSAQFALCFALAQGKTLLTDAEIFTALAVYQKVAWDGKGIAPSGLDVAAQLKGGFCYVDKTTQQIESNRWPFEDATFCLLHTGKKLATHHHLQALNNLDVGHLVEIVQAGYAGLKNKSSAAFTRAIQQYAEALQAKNLVAEHTLQWCEQIALQPAVLAVKGCGAMGADILFVLLEKGKK